MSPKTVTPADLFTVIGWTMRDNGWSCVVEQTHARYLGKSEFFSGVTTGSYVTVIRETYFRADGTVSTVSHSVNVGGASLRVDSADIAL